MPDSPTILRATDCDGSTATIYPCTLPTWGWQYVNPKMKLFDYGWGCSEAEAVAKAQKLLKPDSSGNYPNFVVVEVK